MKRVSIVCAIAALVATAMPLSSATAQTWEIHQYFGTPSLAPIGAAVGLPGVNPTIVAAPGATVYLPVFIRMQVGDSVGQPQILSNFLYGVSGTSSTSSSANYSAAATLNSLGSYTDPITATAGGTTAGANAPAGNFSLVSNMGYQGLPPGNTNAMGSVGSTLGQSDPVNHAWWVGTVAVTIAPGTPAGALNLWFREGVEQLTSLVGAPYATSDATVGSSTVGFGADASGNPDDIRFGAATLINGRATAAEMFSTSADATINVAVPEPGTLGLLALGLLGLRRRKSC